MNLDFRDLAFWQKEAKRKNISDFIKQIQAYRVGMADKSGFESVMSDLNAQLATINEGYQNTVSRNWAELKTMRR